MAGVLGDISGAAPPSNGASLGQVLDEQNPQALYRRLLGLGVQQNRQSSFLGNLYGDAYQTVLGQAAQRGPDYSFTQGFMDLQPQLQAAWQAQGPRERGLNYSDYLGHVRHLL